MHNFRCIFNHSERYVLLNPGLQFIIPLSKLDSNIKGAAHPG